MIPYSFFINLPTGGIAFLILLVFLKLNPKPRKTARQLAAEFDFIGLLLVVAAAVLLLVGFSNAASQGWNNATTIACIVVGAVLFVVFGAWEFHTTRLPIVSPRLFKTRTTSLVLLSVFCHGLTFFAAT
jgi:cyanate permease